jgi:hypothetical protein
MRLTINPGDGYTVRACRLDLARLLTGPTHYVMGSGEQLVFQLISHTYTSPPTHHQETVPPLLTSLVACKLASCNV